MLRILLILIAVPVLLVIAAALLIPLVVNDEKLLEMAATSLKEQTGAILTVDGEASLSLIPRISLDLQDTGIIMPGEQAMTIKARSLGIGLELWPLFTGSVQVGEIAVDGLTLTMLSAPAQPALDTSSLSDEQLDAFYAERRDMMANAAPGEAVIVATPLVLNVQRLQVTDSVLETVSAETGDVSRVEIINLEATDLNLEDRTIPLNLTVRVDGGDGAAPIEIAMEGKVRINATESLLTLESLAVDVVGALSDPVSLKTRGVVELNKQAVDLQLELAIGDTRGDGTLRFASFETPQIDAQLHLNQFDPALMALAGPQAGAAPVESPTPDTTDDGNQPLPLNAIRAIDTKAKLTIDRVNLSGHVIEKVKVKLRAVDGIVRVNSLTGRLHGGELNAKATFNAKHNKARFSSRGSLAGMDIALALKAMESEQKATGKTDLEWKLKSSGSTSNALIQAMNGPIDIVTSKVTLQDLGIEKMLCEAVALANGESLANALPDNTLFETLSINLKMNKGKLQMEPLRAELADIKLNGQGELDILSQDFSATVTATLSEGLSKLDPACRVNERYADVGWPVNCKGSIAGDPADWCSVDSEEIIEQMATKEVKRQVEKEAGKLLDKLFNRD